MKTELFISFRYLLGKRKQRFICLISIISVLGVAIGVMALIVVLAVMTGFDRDLHDKIIGNYSDIIIQAFDRIDDTTYNQIETKISALPYVTGISPNVYGQVVLRRGNSFYAVGLRGILPEKEVKVSKLEKYLLLGSIDQLGPKEIIIGGELAGIMGLNINDEVEVYSPKGTKHFLKIKGIFRSGMYEYDLNLAVTYLKTAQEILGMNDSLSTVAIKLRNHYQAPQAKLAIQKLVGINYMVKTWMEINQNFFAALKLEKLAMFIILTLIILVASFNIVSTLVVMVVEKTKDIGILRAIGMTAQDIRKIFMFEGMLIGILGIFSGSLAGIFICALLKKYQFIRLPQDIYYLDHLPVVVQWWPDIFVIIVATLTIVFISAIYPANKAASLRPVDALRYE